jgi:hypothetical protein
MSARTIRTSITLPTTTSMLILWAGDAGAWDPSDPSNGPVISLLLDVAVESERVVNVCELTCTIALIETAVETTI